jgi:hypothetical protein
MAGPQRRYNGAMRDPSTETRRPEVGGPRRRDRVCVVIGGAMLLASLAVLRVGATRTDWARVAAGTRVASPDRAGATGDTPVSVTGPITSTEPLGDPEFVRPGPFVSLRREVEQFAWVERPEGRGAGGSRAESARVTYRMEWTADPPATAGFRAPDGHANVPLAVRSARFVVPHAAVGVWRLDLAHVAFQEDTTLPPTALQRTGQGERFVPAGPYLFGGEGTPDAPRLGDVRVRLRALRNGSVVTAFGRPVGSSLAPIEVNGRPWTRVLSGDRGQAIRALADRRSPIGRVRRGVGLALLGIAALLLSAPFWAIAARRRSRGSARRG